MTPEPGGFELPRSRWSSSRDTGESIEELRAEVDRLLLITEALWKLVQEKHELDDKELLRRITVIDMADGKLDSRKAKSPPKPCPKCGRALAKSRPRCMFCGEPVVFDPFDR